MRPAAAGEAGDRATDAWLAAIARNGWHGATLQAASQEAVAAGIGAEAIIREVGDRIDALSAFLARVEGAALGAAAGQGSVRERLFDGLMAGFDVLQEARSALLAIRDSRDPGVAALVASHAPAGLRRLAAAAGIESAGVRGTLRMAALLAIAARSLQAWQRDLSPDMSATMAELDRLLARAEELETQGFSFPGLRRPFAKASTPRGPDGLDLRPSPGPPEE